MTGQRFAICPYINSCMLTFCWAVDCAQVLKNRRRWSREEEQPWSPLATWHRRPGKGRILRSRRAYTQGSAASFQRKWPSPSWRGTTIWCTRSCCHYQGMCIPSGRLRWLLLRNFTIVDEFVSGWFLHYFDVEIATTPANEEVKQQYITLTSSVTV